ncbi:MAG: hypothetical protein RL559_603 [Pseudomonadota bacterium]
MHVNDHPPRRLADQPGFWAMLAAYTVLELSFNHRLLEVAGGVQSADAVAQLHSLELWARCVSGAGLALLLMRGLDRRIRSRWRLVFVSSVLGLVSMWQLQKALVDTIVASASPQDLQMSVQAHLSTPEALKGRVALRDQPVLPGPVAPELRPVMHALWASSVLGLSPDDLDMRSGAAQLAHSWMTPTASPTQMRDAYRQAVMTPVALGSSLLFGLLNICQLLAGLSGRALARVGGEAWQRGLQRACLPAWVLVCAALSWWPGNAWVQSPGYQEVARPALWQAKPFLAPFVDWSLRAEPAWARPLAWVHQALLLDFEFREPWATLALDHP